MTDSSEFEIFLTTPPGLETFLLEEVKQAKFKRAHAIVGGVAIWGAMKPR